MHVTKENPYKNLADTRKLFLLLFFFLSYLILQLADKAILIFSRVLMHAS
jgi:hypothetical protein